MASRTSGQHVIICTHPPPSSSFFFSPPPWLFVCHWWRQWCVEAGYVLVAGISNPPKQHKKRWIEEFCSSHSNHGIILPLFVLHHDSCPSNLPQLYSPVQAVTTEVIMGEITSDTVHDPLLTPADQGKPGLLRLLRLPLGLLLLLPLLRLPPLPLLHSCCCYYYY